MTIVKIVGGALKAYVQIGTQSKVKRHRRARERALFLCLATVVYCPCLAAQSPQAQGGIIHGIVKSGNMPLPGATVTAANTLTGQKVTTSTDVDGSYSVQVPSDGRYVVRAQMAAFAPVTQEVRVNDANRNLEANLELILLSRVPKAEPANPTASAQAAATGAGRGFQNLTLEQSAEGRELNGNGASDIVPQGMPVPGIAPDSATESVAISGNSSSPFATMSSAEMQQRFNDARQQGGGFGGGGFGGPGGFGGGGGGGFGGGAALFGRRGFDINKPHGSIYYGIGDSALNAAPYSLTGQPVIKPAYEQNSFRRIHWRAAEYSQDLPWRRQDFLFRQLQRKTRRESLRSVFNRAHFARTPREFFPNPIYLGFECWTTGADFQSRHRHTIRKQYDSAD